MGISYEEAVMAQANIEDELLKDPNVVSVGVIEEIDDLGQKTGNYVIQVGVISIETYQNTIKHGKSVIPPEYILHSENNGQEEKHVRVNVVKEGKIEALSNVTQYGKEDFPSAIDEIQDIPGTIGDTTLRRRPSPCGQSIGHPNVTAGTIGLLLKYEQGPNVGKAYVLSNNHVLAVNNLAYVGDSIIQPGKHDSGVVGKDTIARLYRWVPINTNGSNYVDAAIAEVEGGSNWSKYVTSHVSKIGIPNDFDDAKIGMNVEKTGRTTGYTQGQIISINETVKVSYPMGIIAFKNQIRTTSMSKGGDSGSCLFERNTKKPVGLLFAGSESASFFNSFRTVLSSLSNSHTNTYPSGKTQVFSADYPLTILKRPYFTLSVGSFKHNTELFKKNLKELNSFSLFKVNKLLLAERNFSCFKRSISFPGFRIR